METQSQKGRMNGIEYDDGKDHCIGIDLADFGLFIPSIIQHAHKIDENQGLDDQERGRANTGQPFEPVHVSRNEERQNQTQYPYDAFDGPVAMLHFFMTQIVFVSGVQKQQRHSCEENLQGQDVICLSLFSFV